MKIYISADLEGVAGIIKTVQVTQGTPEYNVAVKLLLKEINAAIEGLLSAGVDEIIVADMHSSGFNLPIEDLHPAAEYIMGGPHWPRFPYLDQSVDGMILLAYHAMAGTLSAIRDHTMSSEAWHNFYINGVRIGEVEIDAAIAGYYGVPVIMVTGDDKVCDEAKRFIPGVTTAQVKRGIFRERMLTLAPAKAQEVIKAAAQSAVRNIGKVQPFTVSNPVEIKIEYNLSAYADSKKEDGISIVRQDARTMIYRGDDILDALSKAL